ncbi:MAG TPA: hypothetical protein DDW53_08410 [Lachnoclostridium sp.]|jgi:hypothetical protein|nr:hypothetical protein [Lachnoclostridium sp.]
MMKPEFEKLIGKMVSDEEYSTIEYVYTWHPAIDDVNGKGQIADLYKYYGMTVIEDMMERAGKMEKLEGELKAAQRQVTLVQDRIKMLRGEEL